MFSKLLGLAYLPKKQLPPPRYFCLQHDVKTGPFYTRNYSIQQEIIGGHSQISPTSNLTIAEKTGRKVSKKVESLSQDQARQILGQIIMGLRYGFLFPTSSYKPSSPPMPIPWPLKGSNTTPPEVLPDEPEVLPKNGPKLLIPSLALLCLVKNCISWVKLLL